MKQKLKNFPISGAQEKDNALDRIFVNLRECSKSNQCSSDKSQMSICTYAEHRHRKMNDLEFTEHCAQLHFNSTEHSIDLDHPFLLANPLWAILQEITMIKWRRNTLFFIYKEMNMNGYHLQAQDDNAHNYEMVTPRVINNENFIQNIFQTNWNTLSCKNPHKVKL